MRSILPWDSGDIDTGFYGDWQKVKNELDKYMKEKEIVGKLNTGIIPEVSIRSFSWNFSFVSLYRFPKTNTKPSTCSLFLERFFNFF